jgi:hypothetical protein
MAVSKRAPTWTGDSGSELEREKVMMSLNSGELAMKMEKKSPMVTERHSGRCLEPRNLEVGVHMHANSEQNEREGLSKGFYRCAGAWQTLER